MNEIHSTNLRLNMGKESHRKAWEYLQTMDKGQFKSYSNVIALALVEFFEKKARLQDDPYFETREREERFIRQIISEVEKRWIRFCPSIWPDLCPVYRARRKATMIQPKHRQTKHNQTLQTKRGGNPYDY